MVICIDVQPECIHIHAYLIYALRIKIEGVHLPSNAIMPQNTQITRINLTKEKRDEITVSRRADHKTVKRLQ